MMARALKFKKGEQITDVGALVNHILDGGWIYMNHKVLGPGWTQNLNVWTLKQYVRNNRVWLAEENTVE